MDAGLVTTVLAAADSARPVANGVPPPGLTVVVPTSTVVVAAAAAPAAGICGLAVLVASLGVAGAGRTAGLLGGSLCATSGPVTGLTPVQAQNARVVTATTDARTRNPKAAVVAVMTALTESGLRVLSNPAGPGSATQGAEGIGYDHDSVGLFQQRSTWGTAAQRVDPVTSTNLFLDAMLTAPSWPAAEPWRIAQDVQRSAFTGVPTAANHFSGVYGGNYRAFVSEAQRVVTRIRADGVKLDCGGASAAVSPGARGAHGLPSGFSLPRTSTSPRAAMAVRFALAQLGKPYVWGASGPDGYDCSGLMAAAWGRAGVAITRTTYTQLNDGTATTAAALLPGDLVLTPGSDGSLAAPGHVGMFIGRGLVVEAPRTGDVIKVVTYGSFTAAGLAALRHIG